MPQESKKKLRCKSYGLPTTALRGTALATAALQGCNGGVPKAVTERDPGGPKHVADRASSIPNAVSSKSCGGAGLDYESTQVKSSSDIAEMSRRW